MSMTYDVYLRPCTNVMMEKTTVTIEPTVKNQVDIIPSVLSGTSAWNATGSNCRATVTVSAKHDGLQEGDHYLTLRHKVTDGGSEILLNDNSPLLADNVLVRIYDYDTAGVMIRSVGGVTATIEYNSTLNKQLKESDHYEDKYEMRLTRPPPTGKTVTVTAYSKEVATDRDVTSTPRTRNFDKRNQVYIEDNLSFDIKFTNSDWNHWTVIRVSAIDDVEEEGVDYLNFPSQPSNLALIQGPLRLQGFGSADVPDIDEVLLFPGETDTDEFVVPKGATVDDSSSFAIEEDQVDTLIINHFDVRGNNPTYGTLYSNQLTGFGMHQGLVIAGADQDDGIAFTDMELIEIQLSPGKDVFTVESTCEAIHVLDLGDGSDVVRVKDISGPFIIRGEEGSDHVTVSSDDSKIHSILALLAFDGGSGDDTLVVDDTGDTGVDTVLNVTRALIEVESMEFEESSRAPQFSHWIDFRGIASGDFTIEIRDDGLDTSTFKKFEYSQANESSLEATIQDVLLPTTKGYDVSKTCGTFSNTTCTNAVKVYSVGDGYLVFFVGERLDKDVYINVTTQLDGFEPEYFQNMTQTIIPRNSDITYYNVETLEIGLGDASTVVNVRGTSATTSITTQQSDDFIFISSEANQDVSNADVVDVLLGWLDYIEQDLHINANGGRHRMLISDEKSEISKGAAENPAHLQSESLTELASNLGDIFFNATGGNWNAGLNIWLGKNKDTLKVTTIPSVDSTTGTMTATMIHAGDGDDVLTVSLSTDDQDGALFIANGQDGNDIIDASGSSFPLILIGDNGADTLTGGTGSDIVIGDYGRVSWIDSSDGTVAATTGRGGYNDFTDGIIRTVSIIESNAYEEGGEDEIVLGEGDNVGIGGAFDDTIECGTGNDIASGDSIVIIFNASVTSPASITSMATGTGGNDKITLGEGDNICVGGAYNDTITSGSGRDIVFGDSAFIDFSPDDLFPTNMTSLDPEIGGADTLNLGDGDNVGVGGAETDTITCGVGHDIVAGDSIEIIWTAGTTRAKSITSLNTSIGGNDNISLSEGDNICVGGAYNDTITSGSGRDIVAGDSVVINFSESDYLVLDMTSLMPNIGGYDNMELGDGDNVAVGGNVEDTIKCGVGHDIVAGDSIEIIWTAGTTRAKSITSLDTSIGGNDDISLGEGDYVICNFYSINNNFDIMILIAI